MSNYHDWKDFRRDAVMAADYMTDKAFRTTMLHRVDKTVLRTQYPGTANEQGEDYILPCTL